MASISSLMGGTSSTGGLYGNRNVISGLATGMDTESLIENALQGYKTKISSLQQDRTKVTWEQEAYRSMSSKLASFSEKYASYTSGTNLLAAGFFNSSVNITTNGTNAGKISATGKTSSDVQITSVKSLATAARYTTGIQNTAGLVKVDTSTKLKDLLGDSVWGGLTSKTLTVGSTSITVDDNTTIGGLMEAINKDENATFSASFSTYTGNLSFTAKETGKYDIDENDETAAFFGGSDLAKALFGMKPASVTDGKDAEFTVTVNGAEKTVTDGKSNTIDIDGMKVTLKGEFTSGDAVTFTSAPDSKKIVDAVKKMVEDYNAMAKEIKDAYSTLPLQNSKGKYYEPLTEEDEKEMSESAIKAHEEKAKTGLLFGDRDLSNLYNGLRDALNVLAEKGGGIGLSTSYSNGLTTLTLDEDALAKALEEDPDKVKEVFTSSKENGGSYDGLMQGLKNVTEKYARTTGATKGILIEKAGSPLAATTLLQNTLQTELNKLDEQIKKWQDRANDQIDFYTSKFTALEQLVAQMNNQSGMLMGLSGGY